MTLRSVVVSVGLAIALFSAGFFIGVRLRDQRAKDWRAVAEQQIDSLSNLAAKVDTVRQVIRANTAQADSIIAAIDADTTPVSIQKLERDNQGLRQAFALERKARKEAESALDLTLEPLKRSKALLEAGSDVVASPSRRLLGFIPVPEPYVGGEYDLLSGQPTVYGGVQAAGDRATLYVEGALARDYRAVSVGAQISF